MGWDAPWHWVIVAILVIALFGYKRLPDASRSLGRSLRIFKTEIKGLTGDDAERAAAAPAAPAPHAAAPVAPAAPAAPVVPPAVATPVAPVTVPPIAAPAPSTNGASASSGQSTTPGTV